MKGYCDFKGYLYYISLLKSVCEWYKLVLFYDTKCNESVSFKLLKVTWLWSIYCFLSEKDNTFCLSKQLCLLDKKKYKLSQNVSRAEH